jgi:hypothetical protein
VSSIEFHPVKGNAKDVEIQVLQMLDPADDLAIRAIVPEIGHPIV